MDYLFYLQQLRQAAPQWLNQVILVLSEFAGGAGGLAVMALVYWCLSKRAGQMLMMNYSLSYFANAAVKNIFCVRRPFERDLRLTPYVPVTGYSFPSGHTMMATGLYGSIVLWQRDRRRVAAVFCLLIPFTAFTRNWLGAHTLEDVLVGIALACGVIALNSLVLRWAQARPGRDLVVLASAVVLCVALCLAVPAGVKAAGMYLGVMLGWVLERRLVHHEIRGGFGARSAVFVLGMALVGVCYKVLLPRLFAGLGGGWADAATYFVTFLMIMALWPAVVRWAGQMLARKRAERGRA